ncbi:hypothetical protein ACIBI9_31365 [Nonomuraea sp. NPDC050451]|uniref:hypothetical protein n=1 Tax=Nonomuraea sp. NPDC050451 TaxID=3364364 RepID=UPI0037932B20
MANFVFNVALGIWGYYAGLPATNDALIMIPIESSGVESDATLKDKDTFADVVSGATNEQTTLGRKTLGSITNTVNDTSDKRILDCADVTWTSTAGNAVSDVVVCYDPDTTGGTDADLIPLFLFDCSFTPDGTDFTAVINAAGLAEAV